MPARKRRPKPEMPPRKAARAKPATSRAAPAAPPVLKRGQPPHVPTEKSRARVTAWSGGGIELAMIAAGLPNPTPDNPERVGISIPTLKKHYRAELLTGKSMMDGLAISALGAAMQRGGKEAVVAAKWWTQSRMGWSERITVVDGGAEADVKTMSDNEVADRLAKVSRSPAVLRAAKATTVH